MQSRSVQKTGPSQLLATFRVSDAWYALEADVVLEVIRVSSVTAVAHAPAEVVGVINLRGRIVTLLDVGLLLGVGASTIGRSSRILVAEDHGEYIGLLSDQVGDVRDVAVSSMQPPPANMPEGQVRYCKGVYRAGSRVISLLDARSLVAASEAVPTAAN
jgi:purine-binding chemotaxis protein CheW